MHVYDPSFAKSSPRPGLNPKNATVSDYRLLQKRTGTTRVVVVTPRHYATDNRVTLDARAYLGAGGSRGERAPPGAGGRWSEPLAKRVTDLGWHLQIHIDGEQIVANADLLRRLP